MKLIMNRARVESRPISLLLLDVTEIILAVVVYGCL